MSGGDAVFDQSDLPTFRKMAEVYTRLAAEEGDAGAKMVHRIVAEVTTRLVAAMPVPSANPGDLSRVLPVHVPTVGHKGTGHTDAGAFRRAAQNLHGGYSLGGSNLRTAIAGLLTSAADALDRSGQPDPEWSFHEYQQAQMRKHR